MSTAEAAFWRNGGKYHDLAEEYERNIEIVHPGHVTSDRLSPYSKHGLWNITAVKYYEYRGRKV